MKKYLILITVTVLTFFGISSFSVRATSTVNKDYHIIPTFKMPYLGIKIDCRNLFNSDYNQEETGYLFKLNCGDFSAIPAFKGYVVQNDKVEIYREIPKFYLSSLSNVRRDKNNNLKFKTNTTSVDYIKEQITFHMEDGSIIKTPKYIIPTTYILDFYVTVEPDRTVILDAPEIEIPNYSIPKHKQNGVKVPETLIKSQKIQPTRYVFYPNGKELSFVLTKEEFQATVDEEDNYQREFKAKYEKRLDQAERLYNEKIAEKQRQREKLRKQQQDLQASSLNESNDSVLDGVAGQVFNVMFGSLMMFNQMQSQSINSNNYQRSNYTRTNNNSNYNKTNYGGSSFTKPKINCPSGYYWNGLHCVRPVKFY